MKNVKQKRAKPNVKTNAKMGAKTGKPKLTLIKNPNPPQQRPHPFERFLKIVPTNVNANYGNINRMNTRIPRRRAS